MNHIKLPLNIQKQEDHQWMTLEEQDKQVVSLLDIEGGTDNGYSNS